jgi:hypothetical protein
MTLPHLWLVAIIAGNSLLIQQLLTFTCKLLHTVIISIKKHLSARCPQGGIVGLSMSFPFALLVFAEKLSGLGDKVCPE